MNKLVPRHIAIIMDGNGRWAKLLGKSRIYGHRIGVKSTREAVKLAVEYQIPELTLYTFSSENWSRSSLEVNALLKLFKETLAAELKDLVKNEVCVRFIGDISVFDKTIKKEIKRAERTTTKLDKLRLNIALNYGGRWDIANAVKNLYNQNQKLSDYPTIQTKISEYLKHHSVGDVDLMIRTGGEFRISNFLLWQSAYAELYFSEVLWPDFRRTEFIKALEWFSHRQRRFGGVPD